MALDPQNLFAYLKDTLGIDTGPLNPESPLFSSGIVDSFALVSLMTHIESLAGIRVGPDEVTLDNFDSVSRILSYVGRKRGA